MASFGEALKRERELREISLREIADATKINIRYLEALEHNRFDILPGGVFNKGFIRAYARFIGADGEALVDGYLQEMAGREAAAMGSAPTPSRPGLHRPVDAPRRRAPETFVPDGQRGNGNLRVPETAIAAPRPAATEAVTPALLPAGNPSEAASGIDAITKTPTPSPTLIKASAFVGSIAVVLALLFATASFRGKTSPAIPAPAPTAGVIAPQPREESPAAEAAPSEIAGAPLAEELETPNGVSEVGVARAASPVHRVATLDQAASTVPESEPRSASPVPPPASPTGSAEPGREPSPAATGGMEFRIEASAPVWVQIACDGEDRLNRSLQAGEGQMLRCLSLIRISATDAGAVRLAVNGARCVPMGEPGTRVEGFAIRFEDFRAICPPVATPTDGRR